jgi:SAM-dependent methyltransferase
MANEDSLKLQYIGEPLCIPIPWLFDAKRVMRPPTRIEVRIGDFAQPDENAQSYSGSLDFKVFSVEDCLIVDFAAKDSPVVILKSANGEMHELAKTSSMTFIIPPRTRLLTSIIFADTIPPEERVIEITTAEPSILKAYYSDREHGAKYSTIDVFNRLFHNTRLEILKPIFRKYIVPGLTVADIGSGSSIFTAVDIPNDVRFVALDLDFPTLREASMRRSDITWVSAAATSVPLKASSLDVIYAGEIIEHVPNPVETLSHWATLLMPHGILILTTPNGSRLSNLLSAYPRPCNPEHISEMPYDELMESLKRAGFSVLYVRGIYIEIFLSYWKRLKNDVLAFRMRWKIMTPVFWFLMRLGRLFPRYAFNLVIVARKIADIDARSFIR